MALWRSSGEAWQPSYGMRPFSPPVLGSHVVLVALHPEGMEVILAPGADDEVRLELAATIAVLAPTSSSYHMATRGGAPWLLVVVGMRRDACSGEEVPEERAILTQGDTAGDVPGGNAPGGAGVPIEGEPEEQRSEATNQDRGESVGQRGDHLDV